MSGSSDETIPQIALFIEESSARPPPPPPQANSSSGPRPLPWGPRPMPHLLPPPPPPPPAVPSTSTSHIHNPVYHDQSPQPSTSFAICHRPPPVPVFDARRPPPPILVQQNNILKRQLTNRCTATSSKLRRTEELKNCDEEMCDTCVQREISIERCRLQMEKISIEDECQTLIYKKKLIDYQRQKDLLHSLVDGDMFRKVEEFVEDVPQQNFNTVLNNLNETFLKGVSHQMLLQIMEYFFSTKYESSPTVRVEDSLRQTLSTMSRSPVSRSSPDLLLTLRDMLYNDERSSVSERPGSNELNLEHAHSPIANGESIYRRYSNGQRVEPRGPPPPAPLPPAPAPLPPAPRASPAPPPGAAYPHYPPPRPYYPPPYPPSPRPSTSRGPRQQYPPDSQDRYPPHPHYYQ